MDLKTRETHSLVGSQVVGPVKCTALEYVMQNCVKGCMLDYRHDV